MTREEAIEELERLLRHWDLIDEGIYDLSEHDQDAVEIALSALRPVSRERVEKVWRGEWNYSHKTKIDGFDVVQCSKCGQEALALALYVKDGNFCPYCGAPMTDEAVEMVTERLEALHEIPPTT